MKKLFIIAAVAMMMMACGTKTVETETVAEDSIEVVADTVVVDTIAE